MKAPERVLVSSSFRAEPGRSGVRVVGPILEGWIAELARPRAAAALSGAVA